ncbi:MAG: glycine cleavage system aminomethyltransferase GcvT [Candidatus Xenobia bacterium]
MSTGTIKRTPLYDLLKPQGKFIDFAGWEMPVEFTGIKKEHETVRTSAGLFDLSHMGELEVRGPAADDLVARCITNDLTKLQPGAAMYSPVCNPQGTILDDIIVYRFPRHLMLVVNASNVRKMVEWFRGHSPTGTSVQDRTDELALVALQGPQAEPKLQPLTKTDLSALRYYHFTEGAVADVACIISRTGYTGEDGFELYVAADKAAALYAQVAEATQAPPIGLGARDTLRLECRMALYGNDIDETTNPLEAGLGWTVKLDKPDFIGKAALEQVKAEGVKRHLVGLQMLESGIPRHGFKVQKDGQDVGYVTSGTFSPTLGEAIALAYVAAGHHAVGTELDVLIRNRTAPARVVKTPFYKGSVKK